MNQETNCRVDEVDQYYAPIKTVGKYTTALFWVIAALSIIIPNVNTIGITKYQVELTVIFLLLVIVHFVLSQTSRFYLVPRAERKRRKQLLTDSFGTPLSQDQTCLYYNNQCPPSIQRLGANTMENTFFSKEIAGEMLVKKRLITGGYLAIWLFIFGLRHENLEILTLITQIVFSGEIVAQWVNLEILRLRHSRTYDNLHYYFLHKIYQNDPNKAIATLLDAFVAYESAKSSAGLILSTKVFNRLNPKLTSEWGKIRQQLEIDFQHDAALDSYSATLHNRQ